MTLQDMLDKILLYLKESDKFSDSWRSTGCFYRGPTGYRCFIGVCIPNEMYCPSMESLTLTALVRQHPYLPFAKLDPKALSFLQAIHDENIKKPDFFKVVMPMLQRWAATNKLEWNP